MTGFGNGQGLWEVPEVPKVGDTVFVGSETVVVAFYHEDLVVGKTYEITKQYDDFDAGDYGVVPHFAIKLVR